jgi:serine/threonine protein kinase
MLNFFKYKKKNENIFGNICENLEMGYDIQNKYNYELIDNKRNIYFIKKDIITTRTVRFNEHLGDYTPLGEGGYGSVFSGSMTIKNNITQSETKKDIAIKKTRIFDGKTDVDIYDENKLNIKLSRGEITRETFDEEKEKLRMKRIYNLFCAEFDIMFKNKNKYMIEYYGFNYDGLAQVLYLFMENLNGIDLYHYINSTHFLKNELKNLGIIKNLLDGLVSIHNLNLVHRDIKPENIIVYDDDSIKFIDFGFVCEINKSCKNARYNNHTPIYASPEYSKNMIDRLYFEPMYLFNEYKYYDIWALGLTIYGLSTGNLLYRNIPSFNFDSVHDSIKNLDDITISNVIDNSDYINIPFVKIHFVKFILKNLLHTSISHRKLKSYEEFQEEYINSL